MKTYLFLLLLLSCRAPRLCVSWFYWSLTTLLVRHIGNNLLVYDFEILSGSLAK